MKINSVLILVTINDNFILGIEKKYENDCNTHWNLLEKIFFYLIPIQKNNEKILKKCPKVSMSQSVQKNLLKNWDRYLAIFKFF